MRIQIVMSLVGKLLYIFGAFLVIPFIYSILFETAYWSFCIMAVLSILLGSLLVLGGNKSKTFSLRDGFLVVSSTWILTVLLGAIPFIISGVLVNPMDALFDLCQVLLLLVLQLFLMLIVYQSLSYCGVD